MSVEPPPGIYLAALNATINAAIHNPPCCFLSDREKLREVV